MLYRQINALCYHASIRPRGSPRWVAVGWPQLGAEGLIYQWYQNPLAPNRGFLYSSLSVTPAVRKFVL